MEHEHVTEEGLRDASQQESFHNRTIGWSFYPSPLV